jgi:hypothetical protein
MNWSPEHVLQAPTEIARSLVHGIMAQAEGGRYIKCSFSPGDGYEDCLLGSDAVWFGTSVLMFRRKILLPSLGQKIEAAGYSERLVVPTYQPNNILPHSRKQ